MKLVDQPEPEHVKTLVAYEVVDNETGEVARRLGVSSLSDRQRDALWAGALSKIDLAKYHIREVFD